MVKEAMIPPRKTSGMTDKQLSAELRSLARKFANRGDGAGSPGEWLVERMGEIDTEQRRRKERSR